MFFKSITFIIFLVGPILLQIFLSRSENKWFGLILPIISFLFSIMMLLLIPVPGYVSIAQNIIQAIVIFIVSNIPTAILIAIYYSCREKFKKKKEIDKMNIQDLH